MSCYNGERWLRESISSMLNQSLNDFEFIIVDDGSTDSSLEIIRFYAANDSRIVVIEKENTGLAESLNIGISIAKGDWIARIDADDISEQTRLEKQLNIVKKDQNIVFVGTGCLEIDQNGTILRIINYPDRHDQLAHNITTGRLFPAHSSAFFKKETAISIGGYRPRIRRSEDRDMWLRLLEHGTFACVKAPLLRIRKHENQISHEEFGKRQIFDVFVARTSYWIRQYGCTDPVDSTKKQFEKFGKWIECKLIESKTFEYYDKKERLKKCFCHMGLIKSFLKVFAQNPRFLKRLILERLFGNILPTKLAKEWIKLKLK